MSYNDFDDFGGNSYDDDFGGGLSTTRGGKGGRGRGGRGRKKNYLPIIIIAIVIVAIVAVAAFFMLRPEPAPVVDPETIPAASVSNDTPSAAPSSRTPMEPTDIAAYVAERTVTISVQAADFSATGSGFFIDDNGTIVTNYHVIDAAEYMEVQLNGGGTYEVTKVIDFNTHHDIAIIQIDLSGNPYLELSTTEVRTGEAVYAIGASKGFDGTFSSGVVSNTSRNWGVMQCIQTTAPISGGNSGGPLVNAYGEVVGINTWTYTTGQNLNFAVRIDSLDMLARDKNYTMNQYREWYRKETMRSYMAYDYSQQGYVQTLINTFQFVTGQDCYASAWDWTLKNAVSGYDESMGVFAYVYNAENFDTYTDYLAETGFEYQASDEDASGTYYLYYNDHTGYYVKFLVTSDDVYLILEAYCN